MHEYIQGPRGQNLQNVPLIVAAVIGTWSNRMHAAYVNLAMAATVCLTDAELWNTLIVIVSTSHSDEWLQVATASVLMT